jgi:hypothetical protein
MELLSTGVWDDTLTIDLESRQIVIPEIVKNLGVESDDSVRVLRFRVPRQYCDVDLSTFAIRVNYKHTSGAGGSYDISSFSIEEGMIKFNWVVERRVTVRRGDVVFNVCFREIINEVVEREFNTSIATLPVLEGLETGEDIAEEHIDILEQLLNNSVHVRADMAMNNQNDPAYVFNRTHWKEVVGVDGIIIPETNATFSQNGIATVVGVAGGLVEGGKYIVTIGGAVSESRCKKLDEGWYVGNGSLYLDSLENTGEGLCIYSSGDTVYTIFNRHKIPGSTTFTMRGVRETIWHKLDDGYMPDPVVLALGDHGIDLEAIVNAGGSAVVKYTSLLWAAVSDAWQSGNRLRVSVPVGNTELVFSDPTVCKVDNDGLCLLMNTMLTLDTSFVALYIMLSPDVSGGTVNTAKTTVYAKSVLLG